MTAPELLCGAESLWTGVTCEKVPHPGDEWHLAEDDLCGQHGGWSR